jgi:DNA-binding transcriptional MerR regulator
VKEAPERLYTIGQAAALTGVSVKAIRFYHRAGLLQPAGTTAGGYRLFTENEIGRLELIRVLRHLGFGIPAIRQVLAGQLSVRQALAVQGAAVDERIRQLERLRVLLRRVREQVDSGDALAALPAIQEAIAVNTQEPTAFVRQTVRDIVTGAAPADAGWAELLRSWIETLVPEPASPDEVAAVQELAAQLADPAWAARWRAAMAALWARVRQAAPDPAQWATAWHDLIDQAAALADAGATASSPATQALLTRWMTTLAGELGQPLDAAFWARFAAVAGMPEQIAANRIAPDPTRRVGAQSTQGSPALARPHRGGELLLAALRWRLRAADAPPSAGAAGVASEAPPGD